MTAGSRERLVRSAMQLFWLKGYGATSVAEVLQMAQVNSGSLYHFFPGKQDLLLAVLDEYEKGIEPMLLTPAWAGIDDAIERVFALLMRYRKSIVDTECVYGCPIGSLALEIHEPDPAVRKKLASNFDAWITAVETCLRGAGSRLPPGVDQRELAEFVLTVMEGGVMQARTFRDVGYFDRAVAQLRAYFDHLLREAQPAAAGPRPSQAKPIAVRKRRRHS